MLWKNLETRQQEAQAELTFDTFPRDGGPGIKSASGRHCF